MPGSPLGVPPSPRVLCRKAKGVYMYYLLPNLNHGQDTRANRTRQTTRSSTQPHAKPRRTSRPHAQLLSETHPLSITPQFADLPTDSVGILIRATIGSAGQGVGPDASFCWTRAKFLETSSSRRPSNFREISGKSVTTGDRQGTNRALRRLR